MGALYSRPFATSIVSFLLISQQGHEQVRRPHGVMKDGVAGDGGV
jgi:hypothetical protein